MKIRMLVVTGIVCLVTGFAAAVDQPAAPQQMPERRGPARPGMVDREAAFRDMLAGRAKVHAEAMKELVDLKKLAEEENATKTAEAIQAMIDKKDAEYKKSVEQFEKQRRERAEQLQKRMSERQGSREPAQPAQPEKKDKADK